VLIGGDIERLIELENTRVEVSSLIKHGIDASKVSSIW
jgi:hypothetical protein